ncbi:MAG: hypothetical protein EBR30_01960 [Cytophagia bacterium]|nr:hypothetical protein [Cytophagia bacterium]
MSKAIVIKLTKAGSRLSTFSISDDIGNVLATDVTKQQLIDGISLVVEDSVKVVIITSTGKGCCNKSWNIPVTTITRYDLAQSTYQESNTANMWAHLKNPAIYNHFYGCIEPYIIEYPFAYQYQDEILQSVQDYTKAYRYWTNGEGIFNYNDKVEVDDQWFNKAVLYNGQQSTGILNLVPKPINNLKEYMKYPIYNTDSKTITYTKSDNFYQYNTFWGLVKSKALPLFLTSCESLSIDKIVNQANMDYGKRSFKKEPLRAKDLKVRHILDNSSTVHLTSQFIVTPSQISYK